MAAHPRTRPGSRAGCRALRRLTVVALAAAPTVLLLGGPVTAAPSVAVSPLAGGCGLSVDVSGLADGPHALVVRTTVLATGADVPVLGDDGGDVQEAGGDATAEQPTGPSPDEPALEAVLTVDGGAADEDVALEVVLDAAAVPDDDRWVRVTLELDGAVLSVADLELTGCGDPVEPVDPTSTGTGTPSATPSPSPTPSPSTTPSPSVTPDPSVTPSPADSATPSTTPTDSADPSSTPTPTDSATPPATVTPSADPTPSSSADPSASPGATAVPAVLSATTAVTPPMTVVRPGPVRALPAAVPPAVPPAVPAVRALLGTGTSGYRVLVLSTYATTTQTGAAPVVAPVPAPVVAPLEGVPAGSLTSPAPSPLAGLLPALPARGEPARPRVLASPDDLPVSAAGDPLVDLAPAGFVLAASFGGLLMTGRRRRA